MNTIKKVAVLGLGLAIAASAMTASAQTVDSATITQIQELLKQVKQLQEQLDTLNKQRGEVQTELRSTLQLVRRLSIGMSGDDVKTLQEILATDPDIYPEGLVTGFFGPLTEKAVKKFQAKFDIEQVGNVGPITLARINTLLAEGAGNSGKVPPGLLIAPGIAKKLPPGTTPAPLPGQKLPPGIAKKYNNGNGTPVDTTAPTVSSLGTTNIGSTTATISWITNELTKATVWYGTTTPLATSTATKMEQNTASTTHSFKLMNLASSTTYYYTTSSTDLAGNSATTSQSSFTTLAE